MTEKCKGGFLTVEIGGQMIDLCQECAERLVTNAATIDRMLRGDPIVKPVVLTKKERQRRIAILHGKVDEMFEGATEKGSAVWFFNLTDEELVKITDTNYDECDEYDECD